MADVLQTGQGFTLTTWFKVSPDLALASDSSTLIFSANRDVSTSIFRLGIGQNGGIFLASDNVQSVHGAGYNDDTWHHLRLSISPDGRITLFVDDERLADPEDRSPDWDRANRLSIGQEWDVGGPSDFFEGHLDEFRIFTGCSADSFGTCFDDELPAACRGKNTLLTQANLADADMPGAVFDAVDLTDATAARVNLTGASMAACNLESANLAGADLSNARLEGGNRLVRANLDGARLVQTNLTGAILDGASLERGNLTNATLDGARFQLAVLRGAVLNRASARNANFDAADMEACQAEDALFDGASFGPQAPHELNTNLRNANLDEVSCRGCYFHADMTGIRLTGADLSNSSWRDCAATNADMSGAVWNGAILFGVDLTASDLDAADFDRAYLTSVVAQDAKIRFASFQGARLNQGNQFDRADLRDTNFTNSTIRGSLAEPVSFARANLVGANFSGVTFNGPLFGSSVVTGNFSDPPPVTFIGALLNQTSWRNAVIQDVSFEGSRLANLDLTGTQADELFLTGAGVALGMEVPAPLVPGFWVMPTEDRTALTEAFAAFGADANAGGDSDTVCQNGLHRDAQEDGGVGCGNVVAEPDKVIHVGPRIPANFWAFLEDDVTRPGFPEGVDSQVVQGTVFNAPPARSQFWARPGSGCEVRANDTVYPMEAIPLINPTGADVTVAAEIEGERFNYLHVVERGWVYGALDADGDGFQDQCIDGDPSYNGTNARSRLNNIVVPAYSSRILIVSWYWAQQESTDYTLTITR